MSIVKQASVATADTAARSAGGTVPRFELMDYPRWTCPQRGYVSQLLWTTTPLAVADLLSVWMSILIASAVAGAVFPPFGWPSSVIILCVSAVFMIVYALCDLYPGTGLNPIAEVRQSCVGTVLAFAGFIGAALIDGWLNGAWLLFLGCALSILCVPLGRSATRSIASRFSGWGHPVLVFGEDAAAASKYEFLQRNPRLGFRPVGIVGDPWQEQGTVGRPAGYLGPLAAAESVAARRHVFWAIVAMPKRSPAEICAIIERHARSIPHVLVLPDMESLPSLWNRACDCGGAPAFRIQSSLLLPLPLFLKRTIDITAVTVGGLLLFPLITMIAIVIKLTSRGPVFYHQQRLTRGGRDFRAWKFRTMVMNADEVLQRYLDTDPQLRDEWERDHKLRHDPRITKVGYWLRKTSLDELPQIWNVLIGEMSLVGPRPIVRDEITKYRECYDLYVKVLPGITGLWQVSGRNNTTYDERVELDTYYVRNWSPWMDVYILARTVKVVLCCEGAY